EGMGMQEEGQLEIFLNHYTGGPAILPTDFICFKEGANSNRFDTSALCMHLWPHDTPVSVGGTPKEDEGLHIYPNPFADDLYINYAGAARAALYNSIGQVVSRAKIDKNKTRIATASLPGGMYFLKIEDDKGRPLKVERLMKR